MIQALMALSLCASGTLSPQQMSSSRTITAIDANSVAVVALGSSFNVQLGANPSTGYSWQVLSYDPSHIRPVGATSYIPVQPVRPGSPSLQNLSFRAVGPGGSTLRLGYLRPWEKNVPPTETFQVVVVVDGPGVNEVVTLNDANNLGNVALSVGDSLVVQLKSASLSPVFSWRIVANNSQALQQVGQPFFRPGNQRMNSYPTQTFRFRAASPGAFFLRMSYQNTQNPVVSQTWEVMVRIGPGNGPKPIG